MEIARDRVARVPTRFFGALSIAAMLAAPFAPASADMLENQQPSLPSVDRLVNAARGHGDEPLDLSLPLVRRSGNTVYLNLRTEAGGGDFSDGNVGVGYRGTTHGGVGVGGYVLGVVQRDQQGFAPRQLTFGGEARADWLRVNGNICLPQTTCVAVAAPSAKSAGDTAIVDVAATALDVGGINPPGFDAEVGLHLRHPGLLPGDWRISAGASRVLDSALGFEASAPRGKLEVSFDDALEAAGIKGAKFTIGGEMHHDPTDGTQGLVSARLRLALYRVP